jgi:peptidoglycan/LPS O-acetylase OafA/YrhL
MENGNLNYIKPLDGIRGLAVILVVFYHSPIPIFQFEFGWVGVNLFFILSGFLITRILVNIKHLPINIYLKNFYLRRVLRIFPLYFFYLVLIFFALLALNKLFTGNNQDIKQGLSDLRNNYPFLLTYTYNFGTIVNFFNGKNYINSVFTGHLWTLSVEEQFYLIAPFIIYYVPIKYLKWLCVSVIFIIPILRLVTILVLLNPIHDFYWKGVVLYNSTVFQLDSFAMGASLVLFNFSSVLKNLKFYFLAIVAIVVIIGAIHISYLKNYEMELSSLGFDAPLYHISKRPSPWEILNNRYFYTIPLINLLFTSLILLLIKKISFEKIFSNQYLVSTGKISYGIYIYHLAFANLFSIFISAVFHKQMAQFDWFLQIVLMAVYLILLIFVAKLSYKYFESRFLRLKRCYGYKNVNAVK